MAGSRSGLPLSLTVLVIATLGFAAPARAGTVTIDYDFVMGAYFDPRGPYSIIQFTPVGPPFGGSVVPVPAALPLGLLGLSLMFVARKVRRRVAA